MRTIVFEIKGPYGHFRKPYAPVSPVTYSFPPPPTVLGIIGAICGYGKDEYLERIGWDQVRLAVGLRKPVSKYRTGLNLINTKDNPFFRLKDKNPHIQIPYEFLKSPHYRIFVAEAKEETMEGLAERLSRKVTVFTPSLGLAQCLAEVGFVGEMEAGELEAGEWRISTVVPLEQVKDITHDREPGRRYNRFRIPNRMRPGRVVEKYTEVEVEECSNPITASTDRAYQAGEDNVLFF